MNMFQAINNAMDIALATDPSAGEWAVCCCGYMRPMWRTEEMDSEASHWVVS